ncbi:MAG: polysaccharide pyruvyl transferase CsaB [Oscillospiraceae bacterium]|nr:polysaccharide pyruvyl transferase CsaB [Oscillospiraceae bacterium]
MKAKLPSSLPRRGVVISGAHGMGNIGDEAALSGILSDLRSLDPSMPICVLSRSPKQSSATHSVKSIHSFNIPAIYRALSSCSLFISGGGTLIQDASSTRSLLYYLLCLRLAKARGCATMMYGCGIGPLRKKYNRRLAAKLINRCVDAITLREDDSREALRALGVTSPEIISAADPALFIEDISPERLESLMREFALDEKENYICFSLRPWGDISHKAELFARACDYAYEKHALKSVFLPLNVHEDSTFAALVAKKSKYAPAIIEKRLSAAECAGLISKMKVLVGVRLHALVFAAKNAVPTVGISYDPKVAAFLKYIGRGNFADADTLTEKRLFEMIDSAAMALPEASALPAEKLLSMKNISRDTAAKLLGIEKIK